MPKEWLLFGLEALRYIVRKMCATPLKPSRRNSTSERKCAQQRRIACRWMKVSSQQSRAHPKRLRSPSSCI
ncbi:hypothetical protein MESS4_p20097 [Mesorhizobium sp. STM 4661]|nr:hypothetical protein MESS4_p20097 [Mesorhizobium sp. STM 4661]